MSSAVDILPTFAANDDLFDAELGDSSDDADGAENGVPSDSEEKEEKASSPAPNHDTPDENEGSNDENVTNNGNDSDNEEVDEEEMSVSQARRRSKSRSPKPRKMKKAAIQMIHSESQRMVRESMLKLPYHQPAANPISHFLKRVPIVKEDAKHVSKTFRKVSPEKPSTDDANKSGEEDDISCTPVTNIPGDVTKKPKDVVTPKLSGADDPFFFDETPTPKLPNKGVQSLMARFMKHASKPSPKIQTDEKPKLEAENADKKEDVKVTKVSSPLLPLVPENKVDKSTPGSRLNVLKEQLESKMKIQRAKMRLIHESQRKLDNEEVSEEEEEMTDEESDSDYEVEKWNEIDERKQEEGSDTEDNNVKKRKLNPFVDDEAADDDDDDAYGHDIDSGSEGDVSDEGNSDGDDESKRKRIKRKHKKSTKSKNFEPFIQNQEEQTLDLFNYDSQSQSASENSKLGCDNDAAKRKNRRTSEDSSQGLCLRLDSIEDDEDDIDAELTKLKEFKSPAPLTMADTSQGSSQSSLSLQIASDGSNESSRIPPGQGNGSGKAWRGGSTTPELLSLFPRIADNMKKGSSDGTQQDSVKKPGKLSQLTLPIEDSQDLFDIDTDKQAGEQEGTQVAVANDFHFSLDEDTQFTQMLDTQGYIFSSKKPRKPKTSLFFGEKSAKDKEDKDDIDELLGLCSGKFGAINTMPTQEPKSTAAPESSQDSHMDELIGLCSGKFGAINTMRTPEPKSTLAPENSHDSNMNELIGLCSGKFGDSWKRKESDLSGGEEDLKDNLLKENEKEIETENEENDDKETDKEEADEDKDDDKDDDDDDKGNDDVESEVDEEKNSKKYGKTYGSNKKVFSKMNFLEEEAELSGSDVGSDEDDDINTDDDELEEDSNQEELPSDEELQNQINKVHMKSILDQDNAELRLMKEMYLQDGDLYTDGDGRKRNFRWRGIDENSHLDLFDKRLWGDEDAMNVELPTEEESKRRKERFERDTFMREEMSKNKKDIVMDMDENSQSILNIIKDTSTPTTVTPKAQQPSAKPVKVSSVPKLQRIPSQKGSFLNRSKATLNRLSSITSTKPNASASGRSFVFQTVTAAEKEKGENSKKMPRSMSVIEPVAKRPKLDRTMSDTPSGSIFAML